MLVAVVQMSELDSREILAEMVREERSRPIRPELLLTGVPRGPGARRSLKWGLAWAIAANIAAWTGFWFALPHIIALVAHIRGVA